MVSFLKYLQVRHQGEEYEQGASRWGNRDLYPIVPAERTYTWEAFYGYWMTAGICLTSWTMGSSLIGYGLNAGQACGAILVGSVLASINAYFCGEPGRDHHLGYTMLARSVFGLYGSYLCILLSCVQSLIYFGIQSYYGGQAMTIVLSSIFPSFLRLKNTIPESSGITTQALAGFLLYFVVFVPIVYVPPYKLQKFLYPSFAFVTCVSFGVLGWAVHANGGKVGNLVAPVIKITKSEQSFRIAQGICSVAGANTGGTVRIADWTRFTKTRHATTPGLLTALPIGITIGALIGVLVTSATYEMYGELMWNPLVMLQYVQQNYYTPACRAGTFFAGLGFLSSQVFVNMTQNVVSSGMDLAGLIPKYITLRRGGLIMCVLGILIQPWRFLTQATTFVTVISSFGVFTAPQTGILLTDYWLVRKHKWTIPDLYREGGIYWYNFGLNWKAFFVFFFVISWSMPGFVCSVNGAPLPEAWTRMFQVTYFFGYGSAILLYYALNRIFPPKGLGIQVDMEATGLVEGIAPPNDDQASSEEEAAAGAKGKDGSAIHEKPMAEV